MKTTLLKKNNALDNIENNDSTSNFNKTLTMSPKSLMNKKRTLGNKDEEDEGVRDLFNELSTLNLIDEQKKKLEEDRKVVNKIFNQIDSLNEEFGISLDKHHKDYCATFKEFMQATLSDIKEMKEKLQQTENEKINNNNQFIIIAEREYFRQECIKIKIINTSKIKTNINIKFKHNFKHNNIT